jgi:soluble lytic murein transglycosylase-like protein
MKKLITLIITFLVVYDLSLTNENRKLRKNISQIENNLESKIVLYIMQKNHKVSENDAHQIARSTIKYSIRKNIDPVIVLAIMNQESTFNQLAVSRSGDISVAQINLKVWGKYFKKQNKFKNKKDIIKNIDLSIDLMTDILRINQKNKKNDIHWFALYHSKTKKHKNEYIHKVKPLMNEIKLALL